MPKGPVEFDALFEAVYPALFRYCNRMTGDPDQAEDLAQEAFFRLLALASSETGITTGFGGFGTSGLLNIPPIIIILIFSFSYCYGP